jgi:hypothetical protein
MTDISGTRKSTEPQDIETDVTEASTLKCRSNIRSEYRGL